MGAAGGTAVPGATVSPEVASPGGPAPELHIPGATTADTWAPAADTASSRPGPARRWIPLTHAWWNTPRLVRCLTGACLVTLALAAAVIATVLSGARDGIDAIGHRAAPQAVRSADLYFALNDMDAQIANLLLFGADPDYATLRRQTLDTYAQRRAQADNDLQRAAEAAAGDPVEQRAVHTVISQLGSYEALVARVQLLEEQAHAPAGKPSADALEAYRQATDLLRQQLLPAADQVTATNSATVERIHSAQRDDLAAGWWWILVTGALALAALAALQAALTIRFRRILNLPLAAATLLTAAVLLGSLTLASRAEGHLTVAKNNSYDSVIALSRARAVAYDMNADESRYLTDPGRAAAYEQSFVDKTQAIARVDGATIGDYDARLRTAADAHRAVHATVPIGGYLGTELRNITFPGEQDAAERVLTAFQQYQLDDRRTRALRRQGRLKDAVTFNTGTSPGQSNADFALFSDALGRVLAINQNALDHAVSEADSDLDATTAAAGALLPAAVLALTVLGVRPRLREYR
ncbi:hypothetical protein [Peterkaempfera sp. SMS 1(5)a]|uniref:hypothetical protein n=1 Tax=Peterkaempfera podocarpi TaxID=3232308 RepID=UPI00366F4281